MAELPHQRSRRLVFEDMHNRASQGLATIEFVVLRQTRVIVPLLSGSAHCIRCVQRKACVQSVAWHGPGLLCVVVHIMFLAAFEPLFYAL